jgi:hypothetical protein
MVDNKTTAPAKSEANEDKKWFEGFDVQEIIAKRRTHDAFVVTDKKVKQKDENGREVEVTKSAIKNRFTHITGRFAFGNVPADMKWTDEQIEIVNQECERRAQDAVREAVEARKNGTFSREVYLDRPRLSEEARAKREKENKARHEEFVARKAVSEKNKKERMARVQKNKDERAAKKAKKDAERAAAMEKKSKELAENAAKLKAAKTATKP